MFHFVKTIVAASLQDRKGVTALEYGILAVGIIAAVSAATLGLGAQLSGLFNSIFATI